MKENTRSRGFASMDAEKQREIARKGGKAAHERGTAHEFTTDEAREAGRKGGERVSHDRGHMAYIGRLGGKSSAARRRDRGPGEPAGRQEHPGQEQATGGTEFRTPEPGQQSMHPGEEQEQTLTPPPEHEHQAQPPEHRP